MKGKIGHLRWTACWLRAAEKTLKKLMLGAARPAECGGKDLASDEIRSVFMKAGGEGSETSEWVTDKKQSSAMGPLQEALGPP